MIIDDDDVICQIIKEKFVHLGYNVLIAHRIYDGFLKTEGGKVDCVILDGNIFGSESGLAYLQRLRSYQNEDLQKQTRIRQTPVIILTGVEASMQSVFEQEGISGFIEKNSDSLTNLQAKIEQIFR